VLSFTVIISSVSAQNTDQNTYRDSGRVMRDSVYQQNRTEQKQFLEEKKVQDTTGIQHRQGSTATPIPPSTPSRTGQQPGTTTPPPHKQDSVRYQHQGATEVKPVDKRTETQQRINTSDKKTMYLVPDSTINKDSLKKELKKDTLKYKQ
jgi:hypothetical protein